jgi:hypothetical protein
LAHGLGPSGSALWSLGPEHFYEVGLKNEQENQLLAQVDLSAEIFGQLCGRFIDVIKQEKQIKVLTWENFRSEKRCALCQGVKSLPNYLYSETDKWSLNGIWHCFGLK